MSSITTSEEIQKQLSIIFGFQSVRFEEIQVGDIIGVGELTKPTINKLVFDLLRYINSYNAMLKDYSGSEIFAIEFLLKNTDINQSNYKIMPKSMVFIPGEYKDCNTLLLALTRESNFINLFFAKFDLDEIGKLFFEIEEVVNRPELNTEEKKNVLGKFAERFTRKIQAYIIEGKWNKKLVGLKIFSPIEQEYINEYLELQSEYYIQWMDPSKIIEISRPRSVKLKINFNDEEKFEFIKWSIFPLSAYYILQNSIKLSADLLKIANTGTGNEIQNHMIEHLINSIVKKQLNEKEEMNFKDFLNNFYQNIDLLKNDFSEIESTLRSFCKLGLQDSLNLLLEKLKQILYNSNFEKYHKDFIFEILLKIIYKNNFKENFQLRSIDFEDFINYLMELFKSQLKIIKDNFEKYVSFVYLLSILDKYVNILENSLEKEEIPSKTLAYKYISKIILFTINNICEKVIYSNEFLLFDRKKLETYFNDVIIKIINKLISEIPVDIEDLISFAEIMLSDQLEKVKNHIKNLKSAKKELEFLFSFIFRNSNFNNFIKQIENEIIDPESFSKNFYEFLRKRMGGLDLYWKEYILNLILNFGSEMKKQYLIDLDNKKPWSKMKLINNFTDYIENKINSSFDPKNFTELLDNYIAKIENPTEQAIMIIFFEQYEYSLSIIKEFPKYLQQKLLESLTKINYDAAIPKEFSFLKNFKLDMINDSRIFKSNENKNIQSINYSYIEFLKIFELEYFSKLVAFPTRIILRNIDNTQFSSSLYTILEFKFMEKFFKVSLSTNYEKVKLKF